LFSKNKSLIELIKNQKKKENMQGAMPRISKQMTSVSRSKGKQSSKQQASRQTTSLNRDRRKNQSKSTGTEKQKKRKMNDEKGRNEPSNRKKETNQSQRKSKMNDVNGRKQPFNRKKKINQSQPDVEGENDQFSYMKLAKDISSGVGIAAIPGISYLLRQNVMLKKQIASMKASENDTQTNFGKQIKDSEKIIQTLQAMMEISCKNTFKH
jgi:hypothetical protein